MRACLALPVILSAFACGVPDDTGSTPIGEGIFAGGCPEDGRAHTRILEDPAHRMTGTDVLGGPGDVLLMNEVAAFVVQGVEPVKTWYAYGGNLIDAVAVEGCAQAGPEQFGELSYQVGTLEILDFPASIFRGFRPTELEILSDGTAGGPARLRVHGVDDTFWLVEHTLIRESVRGGEGKRLSEPFGIAMEIDYTLEPGSPVLTIDVRVRHAGPDTLELGLGVVGFPSDHASTVRFQEGSLGVGGYDVPVGVPWITWASGESSYTYAAEDANLGTVVLSGAEIVLDSRQLGTPITVGPDGLSEDSRRFYLAVGDSDANSSSRHLVEILPRPTPRMTRTAAPVRGHVTDLTTGLTVAHAEVVVQLRDFDGDWVDIDGLRADAGGGFSGVLSRFEGNEEVRLFARKAGRDDGEPLDLTLPYEQPIGLTIRGAGLVEISADESGGGVPAKVVFLRADGARFARFVPPSGTTEPIPPGDYVWTATRGYEYAVRTGEISVPEGVTVPLAVSMERIVDTSGWVAADTHVHSGPSEDSKVSRELRVLTAATAGIEMFVGSDHEHITDLDEAVESAELTDFVEAVTGQELTAVTPEHMTTYATLVRDDLPRGGPTNWFGLDIAELYEKAVEEGSAGVGLNHPRGGTSWMSLIDWDRISGEPADLDPELIGLPAGAALWDWNFDFVETMNGTRSPFLDPARPRDTGHFEDWQAFLNHGHAITAIGSSDVHGVEGIGSSRTYLRVPSDEPARLADDDLATAVNAGWTVMSTGAFARISIDGEGPGATVASGATTDVSLRVEALPEIDVDWILVTYNCDEVARFAADSPDGLVKFDGTVTIPSEVDGHLTAMGFGNQRLPEGLRDFSPDRVPRFMTGAMYVDADADGVWTPPGGKECDYSLTPP